MNDAPGLRVSVIVPSLGRESGLAGLLEALERQTFRRDGFEIIVVLDGAGASPGLRDRFAASGVPLLSLPRRSGPGAARNRGASVARAPWLAFTEDDCAPDPDWLERAIERLDAEPGLDVLEGATLRPGGRPVRRVAGAGLQYLPTNLFVRREAFHRAGGYREEFFDARTGVYFREDSDLGFTLEAQGARTGREPRCRVVHPNEHPRFLDPLRWARRYEMDPLLARRHPERFRERIESHRLGPFRIRRPVVGASLGYVAALLAAAVAAGAGAAGAAAGLLVLALIALIPVWAKWGFDPRRLPLVPLVPFALLAALLRGRRRAGEASAAPPAVT